MVSPPDTDISQLAPGRRALLETRSTLPPHVRFIQARPRTVNDIAGWMILCVGGLIVGSISALLWKDDIWGGHLTRSSSDTASTELAVAVVGLVVGIGSAFGIVEDLRRMLEQSRGEPNRYGLLLDDDALILRVDRSKCHILLRKNIATAEMSEFPISSGKRVGAILLRGDDGTDSILRIPDALADATAHQDIVRSINDWIAEKLPPSGNAAKSG